MKTRIIRPLPSSPETSKPFRQLTLGEHTCTDSTLLFNGGPGDFRDKLFAIHAPLGNFSHCLGILWSEGDHTVLDDAVDAGLLDSCQIDESEANEETARLGNASEPFDIDGMAIVEIPPSVWRADWQFVFALGKAFADPSSYETGEAL